jgi:hypothetical protein
MSKDVSVEFVGDEVIITKHADTAEARETVEAIKRAVEFFNKNDDQYTAGAYGEHEDADDEDRETDEEDEEENTLSERERQRRRDRALARAGVPPPSATRKARTMTLDDLTNVVSTISKRADAVTVNKLATFEVGQGGSRFSSFERATMVGAIAKAKDRGAGSDDQKFSRFLQDPDNTLLRQWALLPADLAELGKRSTLFDDVIGKARASGDGDLGTRALAGHTGGRTVLAVGAGSAGAKPTESDALRDQIIREKRTAAPWMSDEQLGRYATGMLAELERAARGKQERSRPGTLERA